MYTSVSGNERVVRAVCIKMERTMGGPQSPGDRVTRNYGYHGSHRSGRLEIRSGDIQYHHFSTNSCPMYTSIGVDM